MRIDLSPRQLLCFLRVAELGSFSAAAHALGVSHPALSRTIRQVEDARLARLFDRDTRNVVLTQTGAAARATGVLPSLAVGCAPSQSGWWPIIAVHTVHSPALWSSRRGACGLRC